MLEPRPSVVRYVGTVVRAERARGAPADDPEVVQRVMMRLHARLAKLIGPAGLEVLLARALVLARRTHPVLEGITAGPGGTLTGFGDSERDAARLREASTAIIAHFIEVLITLIGEDLVMRLLHDLWPAGNDDEEDEKR